MGMIHLIRKDPDQAILAMKEAIKNIKQSEAHRHKRRGASLSIG
jgi:hypothetical protein